MAAQPEEQIIINPIDYTLSEVAATREASREEKLAARLRILQFLFEDESGPGEEAAKTFSDRVRRAETGDTEVPLGRLFMTYQDQSPLKELDDHYDELTHSYDRAEVGQIMRIGAYILHTAQQQ